MNRKLSRSILVVPLLLTLPVLASYAVAGQSNATEEAPAPQRDLAAGRQLGEAVRLIPSEPEQADRRLEELLETDPLLEDIITYFRAVAVMGSDPERARRRFEQVITGDADSIAAPRAAARLSGLLLADNDGEALLSLAARFGAGTDDPNDAATVSLAAARAVRETDPVKAADLLMSVRRQVPGTAHGKEALDLLTELRERHPELTPSGPQDLYDEALLAGREADAVRQGELLDALLANHAGHQRHDDAILLRAKVIARSEGRSPAAGWLDERIAAGVGSPRLEAKMTYASGSHRWNANESTRALEKFERVVEMQTGISEEQRAWYAMGRIHESKRRYNAAAAAYRRAARGPDAALMRESKWRAGWSSYLAGNYEGAAWVFGAMADSAKLIRGVVTGREEALYWEARSLERAGRIPEATGVYRTLLREIPDGFYAYLVERRTGMHADPPTVLQLQVTSTPMPAATVRTLDRAWQLEAASLHGLALAELQRAASSATPAVRKNILPQLLEIGAYDLALRTSLTLYRRGVLEEDELYPFLYPHAFEDVVTGNALDMGIDPFLVYSLIRQESLFDPWAVSPARAYGLMQLLLPTARHVAPVAGIESVELDDLFQPGTNIRLGIAYLKTLSKRFDGNEVLVLASYNAGERAAERWNERLAGLDEDEFIEQISYRETRNYVKKILRNYRNYRRLYGESAALTSDGAEGAEQAPR